MKSRNTSIYFIFIHTFILKLRLRLCGKHRSLLIDRLEKIFIKIESENILTMNYYKTRRATYRSERTNDLAAGWNERGNRCPGMQVTISQISKPILRQVKGWGVALVIEPWYQEYSRAVKGD